MCKKLVLLMMLAVSAFVLPGSATAHWQFEESPIPGQTFELHGLSRFQSGTGGLECTVQVDIALETGTTTAKANQFFNGLPTEKCKGINGLAFCVVHGVTYEGLPLTVHITETTPHKLAITTGDVQYTTTGAFCPASSAKLTSGTLTASPDNVNAMKTLTLEGTVTDDLTTNGGAVDKESATLSGSLKVTPEGLYGI